MKAFRLIVRVGVVLVVIGALVFHSYKFFTDVSPEKSVALISEYSDRCKIHPLMVKEFFGSEYAKATESSDLHEETTRVAISSAKVEARMGGFGDRVTVWRVETARSLGYSYEDQFMQIGMKAGMRVLKNDMLQGCSMGKEFNRTHNALGVKITPKESGKPPSDPSNGRPVRAEEAKSASSDFLANAAKEAATQYDQKWLAAKADPRSFIDACVREEAKLQ